ncbi:PAS domain S-box protein [Chryseobacterium sp. MHB01]|uniref:response regulator n=1 Tax=Chryseobacterium sp. MHB01 TaxID=3109433 RepID=UPI002AFE99B7|nr:response regulator [Chryseobacterium sp. MHB01]MEA1848797.1 PAS domain S-box protein [Chryseobacterium sp. MHB01]
MEIEFHKLLRRQIDKYLTEDCKNHPQFKGFINAVNESYKSFERDKDLMDHVFKQSEEEYNEINESLKNENILKQKSISNLYEVIKMLDSSVENQGSEDLTELSSYVSEQLKKRIFLQEQLNKQLEFQNLLMDISSEYINIPIEKVSQSVNKSLKEMSEFVHADRAYIFRYDFAEKTCSNVYEYCNEGITPQIDNLQDIPLEMMGDWVEINKKGGSIYYPDVDELPESEIKEILQAQDIKSLFVIPAMMQNECLGFVGFDFVKDYHNLSDTEKNLLTIFTQVLVNVRERLVLERNLSRTVEMLKKLLANLQSGILMEDEKRQIIFTNDLFCNMFNIPVSADDMIGLDCTNSAEESKTLFKNEEYFVQRINKILEEKKIVTNELLEMKNGRFLERDYIPIFINDRYQGHLWKYNDISERKRAEDHLRRQEEKYRNIIANMNLGLIEVDNNQMIQYANQSFCDVSGFEADELIGKNPSQLFLYGENNMKFLEEQIELRKKGVSSVYQLPVKNKRGEIRWWAISGAPNYDDQGNLLGSVGIHLDITDQKKLEEELKLQRAKALEASKAKEVFLANMSHEIRTPLNAIIGFLRELKRAGVSGSQQEFLDYSYNASQHLLSIINNILDISKIESGEMLLENKNFSLKESIENVITILKPKAREKGLMLTTSFSDKLYPVFKGDPSKIEQVLYNILGNALKFTNQGKIAVDCKVLQDLPHQQTFSIVITDTGIGMSEEYVRSIFKKFNQEDSSISRKYGGTGLGMSITKELIHLMKGEIDVKSEKNVGTSITIQLVLHKGNEKLNLDVSAEKQHIVLDGIRVVLVEDNELNQLVAENSLKHYNCLVTKADNGRIAVELLEKEQFDIILMDIQMPEMDGIEATQILRENMGVKTPIIALTANAFKSEIDKCISIGMDDYITKPFAEESLINIIEKHIGRQKNQSDAVKARAVPYDLTGIQKLGQGDEAFIKKIITLFITQTQEMIPMIDLAFNNQNFTEIARLVHKLRPSVEAVGIASISEEMRELEVSAKEQSMESSKMYSLFEKIKNILIEAIEQMKEDHL